MAPARSVAHSQQRRLAGSELASLTLFESEAEALSML